MDFGALKNFLKKICESPRRFGLKMYGIVRGASIAGQAGRVDRRDMCSGTPWMEDS